MIGYIPKRLKIFQQPSKTYQQSYTGKVFGVNSSFVTDVEKLNTHATASKWAQYGGQSATVFERDNTPVRGLVIINIDFRGNGGRAYKVLVNDGHETFVDLREGELLDMMQNCKIEKGYIDEEFIFAVQQSQMKLVRVGSTLHKELMECDQRANTTLIPEKDLVLGGIYERKDGKAFVYGGKVDSIGFDVLGKAERKMNHQLWYPSEHYSNAVFTQIFSVKNSYHGNWEIVKDKKVIRKAGDVVFPADYLNLIKTEYLRNIKARVDGDKSQPQSIFSLKKPQVNYCYFSNHFNIRKAGSSDSLFKDYASYTAYLKTLI